MDRRNTLSVLIALLLSLIFTGMARAVSSVYATATADWTNFAESMPVDYYDQYSIPIAEAERNEVRAPQVRNDLRAWGTVSSLNTLPNTSGYAATTADTLSIEASALADGITAYQSFSSGFISRGGYFTVRENGILNFTVPYSFYHEFDQGLPTDGVNSYALAKIWVAEDLGAGQTTILGEKTIDFFRSNLTETWSADGILTLDSGVSVETGKNYVVDFNLFSSAFARTDPIAVIPEPASMVLLSTGLIGGVLFRRRKRYN